MGAPIRGVLRFSYREPPERRHSLDPFSTENPALQTFAFPLWVWLIMFLMAGFGLGVFGAWVSGRTQRLQAHADRKALQALKKENAVLAAQSTGKAPLIVAEG